MALRLFRLLALPAAWALLACGGGSGTGADPDFALTVTPSGPVTAGASGTAAVAVTLTGGEAAPITLALAANAQAITGSGTVQGGASAGTLALAVPANLAAGTYALVATGSDGTRTRSAGFNLQVAAPQADPWAGVTAAIQAAQSRFTAGLCVEVATPQGVVYSQSFGGFANTNAVWVASASKWVTATVILQLVDQGKLSLDTPAKALLVDRSGQPWSGSMGDMTLRQMLSFTDGLTGDDSNADGLLLSMDEAVKRLYDDLAATAAVPGSMFYYGPNHMHIAARMAEVATGKTWKTLFDEQLRVPLGWAATSLYSGGAPNPDVAGGLQCNGLEYMRFLMMQLRGGLDGTRRALSAALIAQQRADAFQAGTSIVYSPYVDALGKQYHYGLGNWLETAGGAGPSGADPVLRWSSTGTFGWAPWVAADGAYCAIVMTKQPLQGMIEPSETLKNTLEPLIRAALAQNPAVLRSVP